MKNWLDEAKSALKRVEDRKIPDPASDKIAVEKKQALEDYAKLRVTRTEDRKAKLEKLIAKTGERS